MRDDRPPPTERSREAAGPLRRNQTPSEAVLRKELRSRRSSGLKFRRQHPIGPFVLDFYCPHARLAIELDGSIHDEPDQRLADARRSDWLTMQAGITVLRFTNGDVVRDVEAVCDWIEAEARLGIEWRTRDEGRE